MGAFDGLDEAVQDARHWYDAASAIKHLDAEGTPDLEAIKVALEYHFPTENGAETPFGPMWQMDGQSYPLPISDFPDAGIKAFQTALAEVSSTLVRSRLADILWIRKVDQAHKYAHVACESYVALCQTSSEPMIIANSATRAMDLAIQLRNKTLEGVAISNALACASQLIDKEEWVPGASLRIVERLIKASKQFSLKEKIAALLERSVTRYDSDIHVLSGIRDLQASLYRDEPEKATEFARTQVRSWIEFANTRTGILRLADLEKARDLAIATGLAPELEEVRRLIENSPVDESDLELISASVEIPTEQLQKFEDGFFQSGAMLSFLNEFGLYCPLPEDHSHTEEAVRDLMRDHPLQFLMTRVILNEEGLPIKYIRDEEGHFENAVKRDQNMRCQLWLSIGSRILGRAVREFPDYQAAISQYFTTPSIDDELTNVISRAFDHFAAGRFDECVCILVPRLEAALRTMARSIGLSIYSEPSGATAGGYKMLGSLLAQFEGKLPDNYRRYFSITLTDPVGLNTRNRLCHGLTLTATQHEAVLALHIATMLATLRPTTQEGTASES